MLFNAATDLSFQIQMPDPLLSTLQHQQLSQVIHEAHNQFQQESRINKSSAFNVLRVLSTFRVMHPQSPSGIYNCIMLITKNYNPQTIGQWSSALQKMKATRIAAKQHQQSEKVLKDGITNAYSKYPLLTYNNSSSHSQADELIDQMQAKSQSNIRLSKVGRESHNFQDDIEVRDYSQGYEPKRLSKEGFYVQAHQQHYISFEPALNNENMNSTNIRDSTRKYIEAINGNANFKRESYSRIMNLQERMRTPIDQSFIKNMTTSNVSPFLICKQSQAHHFHWRETAESEEYGVSVDEWETMNAMATISYSCNLKFKAFSSLLAHFIAFEEYKEQLHRAKLISRNCLQSKAFFILNQYNHERKNILIKQKQAYKYYQRSVRSRCFKVLKLIFQLRERRGRNIDAELLPVNYEFLISLLFSLRSRDGTDCLQNTLNRKIEQFQSSLSFERIHLILRYFGNTGAQLTAQQIAFLIQQYHRSILRRTFRAIQLQNQIQLQLRSARNQKMAAKCFGVIRSLWQEARLHKRKLMIAETATNFKLLAKTMRALRQCACSAKIYSKRCEYVHKKRQQRLKQTALKLWAAALLRQRKTQQQKRGNCQIMQKAVAQIVKQHSFTQLLSWSHSVQAVENNAFAFYTHHITQTAFNGFQIHHEVCQKSICLSRKTSLSLLKTALKKWQANLKNLQACRIIVKLIAAQFLRAIGFPGLEEAIIAFRNVKQQERERKKLIFQLIVAHCKQQAALRANRQIILEAELIKMKMKTVAKSLAYTVTLFKLEKIKAITQSKSVILVQFLAHKLKYDCVLKMRHQVQLLNSLASHCEVVGKRALAIQKCRLIGLVRQNYEQSHQKMQLQEMIQMQAAGRVKAKMIEYVIDHKATKIKATRVRRIINRLVQTAHIQKQINASKQDKANKFRQQVLCVQTIAVLKSLVAKSDLLKQYFVQKKRYSRQFKAIREAFQWFRKLVEEKKKKSILQKKVFLLQLKRNHSFDCKTIQARRMVKRQALLILLENLFCYKKQRLVRQESTKLIVHAAGLRVVGRLERFYVGRLISKKHMFMAVKFKALRLQSLLFYNWRKNTTHNRPIKVIGNNKRGDRLSTDAFQ